MTITYERTLLEQRAAAWAQAQEFLSRADNGEDLSAEDEAAWERANTEVGDLTAKIDRARETAGLEAHIADADEQRRDATGNASVPGNDAEKQEREAFVAWLRNGMAELSPEHRQIMSGKQERAAQQVATGAAGGYTVPQGFWAKVTETLKFYADVATNAETIYTDSGAALPWPTNDDTSNTGRLLSEGTAQTQTGTTFGQAQLDAYMFSSDILLVSYQLLQDTGIDLEGFLARKLGERLGRIINSYATTGSGSSEPEGFVTSATTGKTTAGATAILPTEIIDLVHSVDVAYRAGGSCAFYLHDLILAYVRKLKDDSGGSGYGRPLWEPSIQVGQPDTLFGYPVRVNNFMASTVTATYKTMAFGDLRAALACRYVNGGMMKRLEERYAEYLQVGYFAFQRFDSVVQDTSAVKLLVQHS